MFEEDVECWLESLIHAYWELIDPNESVWPWVKGQGQKIGKKKRLEIFNLLEGLKLLAKKEIKFFNDFGGYLKGYFGKIDSKFLNFQFFKLRIVIKQVRILIGLWIENLLPHSKTHQLFNLKRFMNYLLLFCNDFLSESGKYLNDAKTIKNFQAQPPPPSMT